MTKTTTRKRRQALSREGSRTQNESSRKRGGQSRNENAKKCLEWLGSYNLSTGEGTRAFLVELIKRTWTGELGTRQAGALNGSVRLLLEHELLPGLERRIVELEKESGRGNEDN